ncbi:MAG: hypothetical protein ABSH51_15305 [Solirubrobacteraceae bacterium]
MRLALPYAFVFIVCGAGLLAITYVLVARDGTSATRTAAPRRPGTLRVPRIHVGSVMHDGTVGANEVSFDGRPGTKRRLAPGNYGVVITAAADTLSTSTKPLRFAIEGPATRST